MKIWYLVINEKLKNDYLNILEKDYTMKTFEPLLYNYGTIKIIIDNYNLKQLQNYNNNKKLTKMKFLSETFLSMLLKMIFMHSLNKLEVLKI